MDSQKNRLNPETVATQIFQRIPEKREHTNSVLNFIRILSNLA